jgi:predicted O-methyltransferase YrrM
MIILRIGYRTLTNIVRLINSLWYRLDKVDDILPKETVKGYSIQWRQKILPDFHNFQNNSNSTPELRNWFYELLSHEIDFDIVDEIRGQISHHEDQQLLEIYPGVYYKILSLMVSRIKPRLSVEVGTLRGSGTICISNFSEKTVTFDILPVTHFASESVFAKNKNISQILSDISDDQQYDKYEEFFKVADFIFIDGPKDGKFEKKVIPKVIKSMKPSCILFIDDILFNNMVEVWHEIKEDKLDITNFGHWSGSGIVIKDIHSLLIR